MSDLWAVIVGILLGLGIIYLDVKVMHPRRERARAKAIMGIINELRAGDLRRGQ